MNGESLLEKLERLGINKVLKMLPVAGYAAGGPLGGIAGSALNSGLQGLINKSPNPYSGMGAMVSNNEPVQGYIPQQNNFLSDLVSGASNEIGNISGSSALNGLSNIFNSNQSNSEMIKQFLKTIPKEELMKIIESMEY